MEVLCRENGGGSHLGLKGFKGLLEHLLAQLFLPLVALARVSDWMWDRFALDYSAGPDTLGKVE